MRFTLIPGMIAIVALGACKRQAPTATATSQSGTTTSTTTGTSPATGAAGGSPASPAIAPKSTETKPTSSPGTAPGASGSPATTGPTAPPAPAAAPGTIPSSAPSGGQPEPVLKTTETNSGLIIEDLRWGTGEEAKPHTAVTIHYKGTLFDGRVFDSSYQRNAPATFNLDQLIKGWQEGIPGMKVGSKRRLIIPPELGYGKKGFTTGNVPIPPDAMLIFEIELLGLPK